MKFLIYVYFVIVFIPGCSKENSHQEINVKKIGSDDKSDSFSIKGNNENSESTRSETNLLKRISAKDVNQYIGDSLNVTGFVAEVYLNDKVAYLNMENKFPKNIFSCAVFSSKFDEFGDLSKYKGKNIEVTGKISTYKNKLQIILNSKEQIKLLQ
jgi:hypothetical protein